MTGPEHYRAAEQAAEASVYAYQRWGASGDTRDFKSAMWEQGMAQLNATLALTAVTALAGCRHYSLPAVPDWQHWYAITGPAPAEDDGTVTR